MWIDADTRVCISDTELGANSLETVEALGLDKVTREHLWKEKRKQA